MRIGRACAPASHVDVKEALLRVVMLLSSMFSICCIGIAVSNLQLLMVTDAESDGQDHLSRVSFFASACLRFVGNHQLYALDMNIMVEVGCAVLPDGCSTSPFRVSLHHLPPPDLGPAPQVCLPPCLCWECRCSLDAPPLSI